MLPRSIGMEPDCVAAARVRKEHAPRTDRAAWFVQALPTPADSLQSYAEMTQLRKFDRTLAAALRRSGC